jgi:hypothetical protein
LLVFQLLFLLLVAGITAVACVTSVAFVHAVAMAILLLLAFLHVAPLFLILAEMIFYADQTYNRQFREFFFSRGKDF